MKRIIAKLILVILILNLFLCVFGNNVKAYGTSGTTIVINPGHGPFGDPGAQRNGVQEWRCNLTIAKYLRDYLSNYYNVNILMTHEGTNLNHFSNPDSLDERADFARNNHADLYVSLHNNSSPSTSANGATVYTTYRTDQQKYHNDMVNLSQRIVNNLSSLGLRNDGVISDKKCNDHIPRYQYFDGSQGDYYADVRIALKGGGDGYGANFSDGSGVPCVLIEHAYLSNDYDRNTFLSNDAGLKRLAEADGRAIVDFYGLRLKSDVEREERERREAEERKEREEQTKRDEVLRNYKGTKVEVNEEKELIDVEPNVSVSNLKEKLGDDIKITNHEDREVTKDQVGTDFKVKKDDKSYTIIKVGDVDGDGEITAVDYTLIKNKIMEVKDITDEYKKMAADVDEDNEISAVDYTMIKNHIMDIKKIEIK